jgi:hypothetical protein
MQKYAKYAKILLERKNILKTHEYSTCILRILEASTPWKTFKSSLKLFKSAFYIAITSWNRKTAIETRSISENIFYDL